MDVGRDSDRAAILKVIEEETAAYFNKDFEAWARCWVQAPHVRHWGWYPHSGIQVLDGWEAHSAYMRRSMERYPSPNMSAAEVRRERMTVRIGVDMAWVTFDQRAPRTGDPFDVAGLQHNMRILEKQDGVWRIACVTCLYPFLEAVNYPLLRVDERATVLWANAAARERLRESGLTISAGRLRARERAANQGLQASIRWAAGAVGYMSGQAAWSAVSSTGGALPVVLSDPDTDAIPSMTAIAPSSAWPPPR